MQPPLGNQFHTSFGYIQVYAPERTNAWITFHSPLFQSYDFSDAVVWVFLYLVLSSLEAQGT